MSKIRDFIITKRYLIIGILAAVLLSMTLKTQVVILTYGDDYSVRMEYTLYGYCIRASAALKAAEPAIYSETYIGNSIDKSVLKVAGQMEKLTSEKLEFRVLAMGYPKNTDKLEAHLKELIEQSGRKAEILQY